MPGAGRGAPSLKELSKSGPEKTEAGGEQISEWPQSYLRFAAVLRSAAAPQILNGPNRPPRPMAFTRFNHDEVGTRVKRIGRAGHGFHSEPEAVVLRIGQVRRVHLDPRRGGWPTHLDPRAARIAHPHRSSAAVVALNVGVSVVNLGGANRAGFSDGPFVPFAGTK